MHLWVSFKCLFVLLMKQVISICQVQVVDRKSGEPNNKENQMPQVRSNVVCGKIYRVISIA